MDSEGFESFVRSQHEQLVRTLVLHCGDRSLAEQLAQDAFVRAHERWERVRGMDAPGAWLHRVAINLSNSWWRRQAAERRAYTRAGARPAAGATDPDDVLAIRAALRGLAPRQREVLVLRYFLDLSVADTATRMGLQEGSVKSLTWRTMADGPLPGASGFAGAVWTGAEVVLPGTAAPGEPWAAYIPSADRWREFPAPPVEGSLTRAGAGTELIAIGTAYTDTDDGGVFDTRAARYADGRWTDLGTTALPDRFTPGWTGWTGDRLLVSVGAGGYPLYALDPATGAWSALPNPSGDRSADALVWGDGRLWSWGGDGDGAVLEPLPR